MGTGVAPPLGWRSVAPLQQMSPSKAPEMKNKMVLELIYYHFIFHPPVLGGAIDAAGRSGGLAVH